MILALNVFVKLLRPLRVVFNKPDINGRRGGQEDQSQISLSCESLRFFRSCTLEMAVASAGYTSIFRKIIFWEFLLYQSQWRETGRDGAESGGDMQQRVWAAFESRLHAA